MYRTPLVWRSTPVQWLRDNGSAYIAEQTQIFCTADRLRPVTTPDCSPESSGMGESFVKTIKRDYAVCILRPNRKTALRNLAIAFELYNVQHQ